MREPSTRQLLHARHIHDPVAQVCNKVGHVFHEEHAVHVHWVARQLRWVGEGYVLLDEGQDLVWLHACTFVRSCVCIRCKGTRWVHMQCDFVGKGPFIERATRENKRSRKGSFCRLSHQQMSKLKAWKRAATWNKWAKHFWKHGNEVQQHVVNEQHHVAFEQSTFETRETWCSTCRRSHLLLSLSHACRAFMDPAARNSTRMKYGKFNRMSAWL